MFDCKESVQNLFNNLTKKIVNQGYVIITIPDANVIVKMFRNRGTKISNGETVVGNKYYFMKIDNVHFPEEKLYGLKYGFYLEDAVGKIQSSDDNPVIKFVPEYLIEFNNFIKIAEEYNLKLIDQKNFP